MTRNFNDSNPKTAPDPNVPKAGNAPAASALDSRPPLSVEEVAGMLGVHRADVMALVSKGALPAKRVGSGTFITTANLAAFVARSDPASVFSRFTRGDLVVWMDEQGEHGIGRFVAEKPDGSVRVLRDGFWGSYETVFPATQVQPFTCRVPQNRVH